MSSRWGVTLPGLCNTCGPSVRIPVRVSSATDAHAGYPSDSAHPWHDYGHSSFQFQHIILLFTRTGFIR